MPYLAVVVVKEVDRRLEVAGDPTSEPGGGLPIGPLSRVCERCRVDSHLERRIPRMKEGIGSARVDQEVNRYKGLGDPGKVQRCPNHGHRPGEMQAKGACDQRARWIGVAAM